MAAVFADPPVLCGHRGMGAGTVSGHVENTLGSLRAALAAGLPWVELDVRGTADGDLVAFHDPAVADGRLVSELGAAEAAELGLESAHDVLAGLPADAGLAVEVKTSLEDALRPRERTTAARVADLLGRARRNALVLSFDPAALAIVRERAPGLALGLLTWMRFPLRKAIPAAAHLGATVVAPHVSSFGLGPLGVERLERPAAALVEVAHAAGLQVAAWCPREAEAPALVAAGVDCLIVDRAPDARIPGPA